MLSRKGRDLHQVLDCTWNCCDACRPTVTISSTSTSDASAQTCAFVFGVSDCPA